MLLVPCTLLLFIACQPVQADLPAPTAVAQATVQPTLTSSPTASATASATATPVPPPPTSTPIPTSTAVPATATPVYTATPEPSYEVHLAAVGDIMLSRTLGNVIASGNITYPFAAVVDYLRPVDVTVGNLETALGSGGEPAPKAYPFISPPASADALALAGFDVVSLANNHGMDYGPETLLEGMALLRAQNVQPVGAGANWDEAHAPVIIESNGLRLAFLGYVNVPVEARSGFDTKTWDATADTPGLAWGTAEVITRDVTAVSARPDVDHVIVILHSGYEYQVSVNPIQEELAYSAIDAGATAVLGHHAHILQRLEIYNGGFIAFGLGNFAFNIDGPPRTAILHLWLDKEGVTDFSLIPAMVTGTGAPRLATPEEADAILSDLAPYHRLR
ncbi:MAG: CapA family protein [Anaerolineales bacterium]|nr:CapA family protein [Anaerolineales bacterium]